MSPEKHTTSSDTPDVWDKVKNTSLTDIQRVTRLSCGRKALLTGIATGAGVGAINYIAHRKIPSACNWAIGSFCGIAIGVWEVCRYQERRKGEQMHEIVMKMNKLESKRAQAFDTEISAVEQEENTGIS